MTSSVPATRIVFGRSLRLTSLNVAIKTFPKQIGAVHCVPDKVVVRNRVCGVGHGRGNSSQFLAVTKHKNPSPRVFGGRQTAAR